MKHHLYLPFFILLYSVGYSQHEGVVQTTAYSANFKGKPVELRKNKIWFKDSTVIYEFRIEMQSRGSIAAGTIVKSDYPVAAYYYLDLRTMMCKQYDNFKDTAMPVYNFVLKQEDHVPFWRFYLSKNTPQDSTIGMDLPDTTIENVLYKRVKITYKNPKKNWYNVYYLKCDAAQNIVHINRTLEQLYPGCKAVRSEMVDREKNTVANVFEYKIISNTLTQTEKSIFKNWGENAKNTKLPVLPFEINKGFSENIKFDEKPIITILPPDSTFFKPQPIIKINPDDVKQWLQKEFSSSTPIKNNIIKKLLQNASFDKMYAEVLHEHEKENLIIIPMKKEFVSQHTESKNIFPLQHLILVETANGEIRRGDIVLFFPDKPGVKELPKNTFYNIFNSEFNSLDGTYALVGLGDVKYWEMDFKDHQKTEFRVWRGDQKPSEESTNCRAWYLDITRHLNWNIQQERKYLGNTCTGCPPNQLCDKE